MNLTKLKTIVGIAIMSFAIVLPASAECLKLGYVEAVSIDTEQGDGKVFLREVAGSGNIWWTRVDMSDSISRVAANTASNAATSGAKVRMEGDAATCPSASPAGRKFMGTIEQLSIITTNLNDNI